MNIYERLIAEGYNYSLSSISAFGHEGYLGEIFKTDRHMASGISHSPHGALETALENLRQNREWWCQQRANDELREQVEVLQRIVEERLGPISDVTFPEEQTLFVRELSKLHLSSDQLTGILYLMDGICNVCWDSWKPCHCWNDD